MMGPYKAKQIFCSWSGGKDSCLALHRAVRSGGDPKYLLTMFTEGGERSRSHGLDIDVIRAQSESLGVTLVPAAATWQEYEAVFLGQLRHFKDDIGSATGIIF